MSREVAEQSRTISAGSLLALAAGAQGGDYGAFTATRLGVAHPDPLVGIHLNLAAAPSYPKPIHQAFV
jgi:hypothetical protein